MMGFDEMPDEAAPREIQRSLVVVGFFVVPLAMVMTVVAAHAGHPHLDLGPFGAVCVYVLPALVHLFGVQLTFVAAVTSWRSRRQAARRALYKIAAWIFLLNGVLMAAADTGIAGFLTAGFFGALGPFFLAGLLDEETGIWLAHKNAQGTTAGSNTVGTC